MGLVLTRDTSPSFTSWLLFCVKVSSGASSASAGPSACQLQEKVIINNKLSSTENGKNLLLATKVACMYYIPQKSELTLLVFFLFTYSLEASVIRIFSCFNEYN